MNKLNIILAISLVSLIGSLIVLFQQVQKVNEMTIKLMATETVLHAVYSHTVNDTDEHSIGEGN
jgi:hypothetical protein